VIESPFCSARSASAALIVVLVCIGCGKKGPPLAPLVKLPVAPADLVASRRGDVVGVSFTVPSTNTDGTRPANVAHAEVYAITAPPTVPPISDASLLKFGTRVGTVEVKAPRDPNHTADEDDPSDEVDAPEGSGLDQGAVARFKEPLTRDLLTAVTVPPDKHASAAAAPPTGVPLLGPPPVGPMRTYVAFGTSTRGRKGPLSKRVTVPLIPPPSPPSGAAFTYDESAVTVTWSPVGTASPAGSGDLLPARQLGATPPPAIAYNIYDATNADAVVKLNAAPLTDPTYADNRVVFGENRCYTIVAAETIGGAAIESEAPPPTCKTLVDTFPPAAPKDLKSIASEGAINLIWEPNTEKDLAGYIVLRGVETAETLQPITPSPIVEPSFKDDVKPGVAYAYAVQAVDKAGNLSPPSARAVDTAR
jgi:hypothetical protein